MSSNSRSTKPESKSRSASLPDERTPLDCCNASGFEQRSGGQEVFEQEVRRSRGFSLRSSLKSSWLASGFEQEVRRPGGSLLKNSQLLVSCETVVSASGFEQENRRPGGSLLIS